MSSVKPSKRISKYARKTTAVRCKLNPRHDPYQTLIAIYLLRLVLGLRDTVDISNLEPLFMSADYTKLTGLSPDALAYPDAMEVDEFEHNFKRSKARKSSIYKAIRNQIKKLLAQELPQNAPPVHQPGSTGGRIGIVGLRPGSLDLEFITRRRQ